MARSGFKGTIPSEIGFKLSNLATLIIPGNSLQGPFPDFLLRLSTLKEVYLSKNDLTGPLSREQWAFMGNLVQGEMYENSFTGSLPDDIGDMIASFAAVFDIEGNMFTGTLPSSLAQVTTLKDIWLSKNLFTGTVPENITVSDTLSLYGNNFTGSVPESVCEAITGSGKGRIIYDCDGSLLCDCSCTCSDDIL